MDFYQKIKTLCDENGISVSKMLEDLGFSRSVGSHWKNADFFPKLSTLKKIAEYFNKDITFFYPNSTIHVRGNNNIVGDNNVVSCDTQETALIDIYRKLDVIGKAKLIAFAAELYERY